MSTGAHIGVDTTRGSTENAPYQQPAEQLDRQGDDCERRARIDGSRLEDDDQTPVMVGGRHLARTSSAR